MADFTQEHMLKFDRTSAKVEDIGYFFVRRIDDVDDADEGKFVVNLHFAAEVAGGNTSVCSVCDTLAEAIAEKNRFTEMFNSAIDILSVLEAQSKHPDNQTKPAGEVAK